MQFNCAANIRGEIPSVGQDAAAFAVSETEDALLDFGEGRLGVFGNFENLAEFFGKEQGVDENADVVEQAGEIKLFLGLDAEAVGEMLADERGAQSVAPESDGSHAVLGAGEEFRETDGVDQIANVANAESENGIADGCDIDIALEEGGIGHAQALTGERFIVRDELNDFFDIDVGRVLREALTERAQHRRHGGKIAQLADFFVQKLTGSRVHCASPTGSPGTGL